MDDLKSTLVKCVPGVHAESSCELYSLQRSTDGKLFFIEKWSSKEALHAHATGEAVRILNSKIESLLEKETRVIELQTVPAGTVEQGQL